MYSLSIPLLLLRSLKGILGGGGGKGIQEVNTGRILGNIQGILGVN